MGSGGDRAVGGRFEGRGSRGGCRKGVAEPVRRLIQRFSRRLYPPPYAQGYEFELHRPGHGSAAAEAKTPAAVGAFVFRVRGFDPITKSVAILKLRRPLPVTTRRC